MIIEDGCFLVQICQAVLCDHVAGLAAVCCVLVFCLLHLAPGRVLALLILLGISMVARPEQMLPAVTCGSCETITNSRG